MTFINFPSNPVLNQEFLAGARKWKWNGVYWQAVSPTDRVGFVGSQGAGFVGSFGFIGSVGFVGSAGAGFTGSSSAGFVGSAGFGFVGSAGFGFVGSASTAVGYSGSRGLAGTSVSIVGSVSTSALLPNPYTGNIGDGYITSDNGHLNVYNGVGWDDVGQIVGDDGPLGYTGSRGGGFVGSTGLRGGAQFVFQNVGFNYSVDGFSDTTYPTLTVIRGQLYYFDLTNVTSSHPLALRLDSGNTATVPGTTGNDPVGGVAGNGNPALVIYQVPYDAPSSIVYQCVIHSSMIGQILVIDQTGYTGSQGAGFVGSAGANGTIGIDGYTGSRGGGFVGSFGFTGSAGINGTNGIDGESTFTWGETPPVDPAVGDRWYDTTRARIVVWIDDGDSFQWVETSASGFLGRTGFTGSVAPATGTNTTFVISNTTTSTSTTTGALVVAGGVGVGGDINFGGSLYQNGVLFTGGGGGGGGADSYVKSYFWEGVLQENVSTKRYYIHVESVMESITVNLGAVGLTQSTIRIKKNNIALNTIVIPANTAYVLTNVNHQLAVNDFLTVDITQSSSAVNLYVTFVYRE
jgi:hypothetical protein